MGYRPARLGEDHVVFVPMHIQVPLSTDGTSARITYDVIDGTLQCREVRIVAPEGAREIRMADLRSLKLDDLREQLVRDWSRPFTVGAGTVVVEGTDTPEAERAAVANLRATRRRVGAEKLRRVADVYRANEDGAPTKAVAEAFDVAHRTAGLYVQRARQAGLLPKRASGRG